MSVVKRLRDLRNTVEKLEGIQIVTFGHQGDRLTLKVKAPDGMNATFRWGMNAHDHGDKNELASLKRWLNLHTPSKMPETTLGIALAKIIKAPVAASAPALVPVLTAPPPPVPQPPKEPEMTKEKPAEKSVAKPARVLRTLTHKQHYALCEWLKTTDVSSYHNYKALAKAAADKLGYKVAESTVAGALETVGKELPLRPTRETAFIGSHQKTLVRQIDSLLRELNIGPNEDFKALLERVAEHDSKAG